MDSNGFSRQSSDTFPAGLRVLVVDDDSTWLKILEKMLKKCNYEVTTCTLAQEALDLLHEKKGAFDIVISDVNMPDMDGFKLLEHVGLTMDLPVIIMSVDGETSRVMKGVQHGACDYLLKPIRMKELQNIWQHVFRKRLNEVKDIESQEIETPKTAKENENKQKPDGGGLLSGRKRKEFDNRSRGGGGPSSPAKKSRLIWTFELHQKFVKAVNQIGFDKVGPKKILELMGDPQLTRENVASHLQKYRLYLSRLKKENQLKAANVVVSEVSAGKATFQKSISRTPVTAQQNMVPYESYAPISCASRITFNPSYAASGHSEVNSWSINVASVQFNEVILPHFHPDQQLEQLPLQYGMESRGEVEKAADLFFGEPAIQQIPCSMWCTNTNDAVDHNMYYDLESSMKNLIFAYPPSEVDFYHLNHPDLTGFESSDYHNQRLLVDVPLSLYDQEFRSK